MIVTQAGRLNAVTVATNMAGRGVDIILGGNPEGLARHEVVKEGHDPDVLVDDFALPLPLDQMPDEFKEARTAALARYDQLLAEVQGASARPRATRSARSVGCTCWAPSATRAAASTTSCVAAPAVRATRARAGSTSASTTS